MASGEVERLEAKIVRLHGLIETAALITSSLDLEDVLRLVLERAQEVAGAEASSILLYNPATERLEFEVALGDKGGVIGALRKKITFALGEGIVGTVARTRTPLWIPDAAADPRVAKQVDSATGFVTRNILCAPLLIQDRLIGVAEVMNLAHPERCGPDEVEIFASFCRQVAMAIENARLHRDLVSRERERQQLEFASVIQRSFLPAHFPTCASGRFQVEAQSLPAQTVGGDFYDFPSRGGDWLAIAVGDVSGKGVPAALFMAKLLSDLRAAAQRHCGPGEVLHALNDLLAGEERRGMFVTLQYLLVDSGSGRVQAANGGHLPLLHYHARSKKATAVDLPGGPPLGILAPAAYPETILTLEPRDRLVLLTDGIPEAANPRGEAFGWNRLAAAVEQVAEGDGPFVERVIEAVVTFTEGGPRRDDVTLLAYQWCG
jgi:sigma-B regulation protein RsbU (phosphoserine phosphatase)